MMSKDLELFKSELSLELFYMHICIHNANTEYEHKVTQGNTKYLCNIKQDILQMIKKW